MFKAISSKAMEWGHELEFPAQELKAIGLEGQNSWGHEFKVPAWELKAIGLEGQDSWGHESEFPTRELKAIDLEDHASWAPRVRWGGPMLYELGNYMQVKYAATAILYAIWLWENHEIFIRDIKSLITYFVYIIQNLDSSYDFFSWILHHSS